MKLYFVRHGESEANTRHVISNRESPFGLTPLGKQQASTLGENLRDIPITAIYSSPILRARETAEILSHSFRLPYQITEALREYDCGILEEKSDEESWKLHSAIAEDWTLNHNYLRKPEGGENFLDIKKRFIPFIENFTHDGLYAQDNILFVGHGGLLQLMLPEILTNIDHAFVRSHGIGHTQCIIAEYCFNGFVCLQWGDTNLGSNRIGNEGDR
jgi:broad specificity phosphatase PhoE